MSEINLASLNLAPFWPDDPLLWFVQTDAQFLYHNVKDDFTKYNYIIAHLDKHCLTIVKDVVLSPPASNKYEVLKKELLKGLRETSIRNANKILVAEVIEKKMASQLLKFFHYLVGYDVEEDYIKNIFLKYVESRQSSTSLEETAQTADVASIPTTIVLPAIEKERETKTTYSDMAKRDGNLTKRVDQLTLKDDTDMRSTSMTTASTSSLLSKTSEAKYEKTEKLCWYHERFGYNANRCAKHCICWYPK